LGIVAEISPILNPNSFPLPNGSMTARGTGPLAVLYIASAYQNLGKGTPNMNHPLSSRWLTLSALGAMALLSAACHDSSSNRETQVRAIHASSDAPNVDVLVNGAVKLTNVPYRAASSFLTIPAGTTTLAVNPTGTSTSVIDTSVALAANQQYTAIVVGLVATSAPQSEQIQAVLVDDPGNAPATGNVKLRVVHGAPGVPTVDIYVTNVGAALPSAPTIPGLAYTTVAPASGAKALEITGGSYEIRATVSGDTTKTVVFDSGSVSLPANGDLLVTAIPASGVSPISLLVAPVGADAAVIADDRAAIRVAHFSPNVPAVDVSLDDAGTTTSALALANVSFPTASAYAIVPAAAYDASVALASNPDTAVLTLKGASFAANTSTSVFAVGLLGGTGTQALHLAAFADDRVPVEGKAKVRVIHLSPDAPAVDVVALGSGGAIAATLVSDLSYPNATTADLEVAPGSYTVAVVPTGTSSPVLPTAAGVSLELTAGEIVTVVAVGCLDTTSGPCANGSPFALKVLSDN